VLAHTDQKNQVKEREEVKTKVERKNRHTNDKCQADTVKNRYGHKSPFRGVSAPPEHVGRKEHGIVHHNFHPNQTTYQKISIGIDMDTKHQSKE